MTDGRPEVDSRGRNGKLESREHHPWKLPCTRRNAIPPNIGWSNPSRARAHHTFMAYFDSFVQPPTHFSYLTPVASIRISYPIPLVSHSSSLLASRHMAPDRGHCARAVARGGSGRCCCCGRCCIRRRGCASFISVVVILSCAQWPSADCAFQIHQQQRALSDGGIPPTSRFVTKVSQPPFKVSTTIDPSTTIIDRAMPTSRTLRGWERVCVVVILSRHYQRRDPMDGGLGF